MTGFLAAKQSRQAPGDRDLRAALVHELESRPEEHPRRLIQEFWIPLSHERADIAEVNGLIAGFEIKSARDNLARLPRQVAAFSAVFDQMSLVCAPRHLSSAESVIPRWWGLVRAEEKEGALTLLPLREAALNPAPDLETRLRLLWKAELALALRALGWLSGHMDRAEMRRALMEHASANELEVMVRSALLQRPLIARRW